MKQSNNWTLFIDDERYPNDPNSRIARNSADAIWLVDNLGIPKHIDFDHDLGGDDTSMKFLMWLEEKLIDGKLVIREDFTYSVHSQNPIGRKNIQDKMDLYIKHFSTN